MLCGATFVLNVPLTLREGKKQKQNFTQNGKFLAIKWLYGILNHLSLCSTLSLFLSLLLLFSPSLQSWIIPRELSCSVSSLAVRRELLAAPALARERYRNCSPSTRSLHRWSRRWEESKDSLRVSLSIRVFR